MDLVIIFDTASMCKLVRQCLNKVSVLICDLVKRTEGVLRRRISLSWRSFELEGSHFPFWGFRLRGAVVSLAAGKGESVSRAK